MNVFLFFSGLMFGIIGWNAGGIVSILAYLCAGCVLSVFALRLLFPQTVFEDQEKEDPYE
jgi:hypothetical protein